MGKFSLTVNLSYGFLTQMIHTFIMLIALYYINYIAVSIKLTLKNVKMHMKLLASIIAIKVKFPLQTFSLPSRYLPGEQLTK